MVNQLHPKMRLSEKSPKNHIEQTFTNAYSSDKMSAYTNSENVFRCQNKISNVSNVQRDPCNDDSSILSKSLLKELEVDLKDKDISI